MVKFPELHRQSTMELPFLSAVGAVAAAVAIRYSLIIAAICFLPTLYWILSGLRLGRLNRQIELQWLKQFPQCIKEQELARLVEKEPARYTVHCQYYAGFDAVRLPPMAVLEDRQTGELMAVYPFSYEALDRCKQAGVEIVDKRPRSKRNAEIPGHTGGTN